MLSRSMYPESCLPPCPAPPYLHSKALPDALDPVEDVDALVNGDAVGVACGHALQQATTPADIQDDGDVRVRGPAVQDEEE